jgi:hypothetical protein
MEVLEKLTSINEIEDNGGTYLMMLTQYSRGGDEEVQVSKGCYDELVEELKDIFDFDSFIASLATTSILGATSLQISNFLQYCSDINGDGDDLVEIIYLK